MAAPMQSIVGLVVELSAQPMAQHLLLAARNVQDDVVGALRTDRIEQRLIFDRGIRVVGARGKSARRPAGSAVLKGSALWRHCVLGRA